MDKLPKAPWRVVREESCGREVLIGVADADGNIIIGGDCSGDDLNPRLDASPEILRAVCALPELVAAVRIVYSPGARSIEGQLADWHVVRDILDRIDGVQPQER